MRRPLLIACAVSSSLIGLSILACGPNVIIDPIPDIPEHVEYDTVRIDYGDTDHAEAIDQALRLQALVGNKSALAQFTGDTITTTNKTLFDIMNQVDDILDQPPTDFDDDAGFWVWDVNAPLRNLSMRFELRRLSDDEIPAQLSPRPISAISYAFEFGHSRSERDVIYDGTYYKFDERDSRQRQQGAGVLRLNFTKLRKYDADAPRGRMLVAFRSRNGIRQTNVGLYSIQGQRESQPLSALYAYTQLPEGEGRFRFFGRQDLVGDDRKLELLGVDAAWNRPRAGRVSARATGGSLQIDEVLVDQCWDEEGITRYQRSTPEETTADGGDLIDCADELESIELMAPIYVQPAEDRDPAIPTSHPME